MNGCNDVKLRAKGLHCNNTACSTWKEDCASLSAFVLYKLNISRQPMRLLPYRPSILYAKPEYLQLHEMVIGHE
jgi:hypothetical protein